MIYERVVSYDCEKTTFGKVVKKGKSYFVCNEQSIEFIEGKNDEPLFVTNEWDYIEHQYPNRICYLISNKVEKEKFIK